MGRSFAGTHERLLNQFLSSCKPGARFDEPASRGLRCGAPVFFLGHFYAAVAPRGVVAYAAFTCPRCRQLIHQCADGSSLAAYPLESCTPVPRTRSKPR